MGRGLEVEGQEVARQGAREELGGGQGQELTGEGPQGPHLSGPLAPQTMLCAQCALFWVWVHKAEVPSPCPPLTGLRPSVPQGTKG